MAAILLYHSVAVDVMDTQLQVHPDTILRHLDWCGQEGYEACAAMGHSRGFDQEAGGYHLRRRIRELSARMARLARGESGRRS